MSMEDLNHQIHQGETEAELWKQTAELTRKECDESQPRLEEAAIRDLEGQLQSLREAATLSEHRYAAVTDQLHEAERRRNVSRKMRHRPDAFSDSPPRSPSAAG